ncbi:C6 zinc finger domain protein [Moelleriella libera RCEF 2490]|uniref:C6 zinc finger domain protein n=1 Tax=Moelleriella libera RCEF 2490 TaxID=1081109 RepID=A0A167ZN29_9HYPO|nr:C6 zinc finger domain protein [Moelleriella libera RCEF 2490]
MPKGGLGRGNLSETDVTGDWIIQLRGGVIDSPALQASVAAYAASHLARENRDSALLQRSRELYTRGLEHLRYALARQSTRLNNETLATCLALSMYELSEAPDAAPDDMSKQYPATDATKPGSAYSSHLLGAMALVELRGPDVNRSPLAHSLFLCVRRYALLGTLINRRDTFLSKKPWKDRPWAVYRKNKLDTCLDALFDMPAVMRQWADVAGEENEVLVETKCNTIIARCKQLHVTLRDWFRDFESSFSGPLYRDQFCKLESSFDRDDCGKVFPISFHYSCLSVAYLLITYWSGAMIVHNLAMGAHYKLAFLSSNSSSRTASCCNAAERHSQLSMMMVRNMCQSTEYFMGQDTGRLGLTMATGVLQGCLATMRGGPEPWEREQGWAMEMMQRIGVQLNLPKREMFTALS